MKYCKFLLFLFLLSNQAKSQTADEIIKKHLNAIGGIEKWKKVSSIYFEASFSKHGMNLLYSKTILHEKGMRQNISSPGSSSFEIMTPTVGWEYKPYIGQQKPEQLNNETVKQGADLYDAQGILIDYKAKGHTVELAGRENIEGIECFKLLVKHKSGKQELLYFDPRTHFLLQSTIKQKINGKESLTSTKFDNYQLLPEGILFPNKITISLGELSVKKVLINKPVNENIFNPL